MLSLHTVDINSINASSLAFRIWYWPHNIIMWYYSTFLFLVGVALAQDRAQVWVPGQTYQYNVRSRTVAGVNAVSNDVSGVQIKANLVVQPKSERVLIASVKNSWFAHIHKPLKNGWDSFIPDDQLNLQKLPITGKPFAIVIENGKIEKLRLADGVPIWEINILKSIVSQLQVDSRSLPENRVTDDSLFAVFNATEQNVDGRCNILYDVMPLSKYDSLYKDDLVPLPEVVDDDQILDIRKTRDYSFCQVDPLYHVHFQRKAVQLGEPHTHANKYITKSTSSRTIVSKMKSHSNAHAIQSSVKLSKVLIRPKVNDLESNYIFSVINLTLVKIDDQSEINAQAWENLKQPVNLLYTFYDSQSDVDDESDLKSMSDSSIESSLENWKKKKLSQSSSLSVWPKLDEGVFNPLFPQWMEIDDQSNANVLKVSKKILNEISEELKEPNDIVDKGSLEKFVILTKLIRCMNIAQLSELEKALNISPNRILKDSIDEDNVWHVFRDVVAQAGTGPALLTIKKWIEEGQLKDIEAVQVLSKLPRTVRFPTKEYVKTLFEIIKLPQVKEQLLVSQIAPYVFSKIIHANQLWKERLVKHYALSRSEMNVLEEDKKALDDIYIPHLVNEMTKALDNGNHSVAQTFIRALGNIVHLDVLLSFEPYLDGKKPATDLQRLLMLYGLKAFSIQHLSTIRSALFRTYMNTNDKPEVRAVAVYLLMHTDPSLAMLQRMAMATKDEHSSIVNSAVISSINSIAQITEPKYRALSTKARLVQKLLNNRNMNKFTASKIGQMTLNAKDRSYSLLLNTVSNQWIPKILLLHVGKTASDLKIPGWKLAYMVTNPSKLWEKIIDVVLNDNTNQVKVESSLVKDIMTKLNMQSNDEPLEAFVGLNNIFGMWSFSADDDTILKLSDELKAYLQSFAQTRKVNLNEISSYDMQISMPTETGLPFMYESTMSRLTRVNGKAKGQLKPLQIGTDLKVVYSHKHLRRTFFVTPHNNKQYVAAADNDVQLHLSGKINVEKKNQQLHIEYKPLKEHTKNQLLHYSVVPFTTKRHTHELIPMSSDKEFRPVSWGKIDTKKHEIGMFTVVRTTDHFKEADLSPLSILKTSIPLISIHYNKFDLYHNVGTEENQAVRIKLAYNQLMPDNKKITTLSQLTGLHADEIPSADKWLKHVQEDVKNVKITSNKVVDATIDVPSMKTKVGCSIGWLNSIEDNVDVPYALCKQKSAILSDKELCAHGKILSSQSPELQNNKKKLLHAMLQYGDKCASESIINVKATLSQNRESRNILMNSKKMCQDMDIENNNIDLNNCEIQPLSTSTNVVRSILSRVFEVGKAVKNVVGAIRDAIIVTTKPMKMSNLNRQISQTNDLNNININAVVSPDLEQIDISLDSLKTDLPMNISINVPRDLWSAAGIKMDEWSLNNHDVCTISKNMVFTFDNKVYHSNLGKCWHVLMIPVPQERNLKDSNKQPSYNDDNNNNAKFANFSIPENIHVVVLVRDGNDGNKEAQIIMRDKKIALARNKQQTEVHVILDNEDIEVKENTSFQYTESNNKPILQVVSRNEGRVEVSSEILGIKVFYNGHRVQIKASNGYNHRIRGLCGNKDQNIHNEFLSPHGCLVKHDDEAIASYALTDKDCEGVAIENQKKYQNNKCVRQRELASDIIKTSEIQSKIASSNNRQPISANCNVFLSKIMENENDICFSVRPVLSCKTGCVPWSIKSKLISFHCMQKNESSQSLKQRIENGANPDMSHKSVTINQMFNVPTACVPI